jgi:Tfp pilus assembly protein PilV
MGALITRGTKIQSGLWFVPFSIKADVTEKEFAAATQVKVQQETSNILYAVAVNNTAESDANRYAVSTYDVDPDYAVYTPDTTFAFTVDKKPVAQIRNRWNGSKAVSEETQETSTNYGMDAKELMWKTPSDKVNTPATEPGDYNDGKNLTRLATTADNEVRYQKAMVPVEVGKPFTIKMSDYRYQIPNTQPQQYETVAPEKKIQYYYVTLDERVFAVESDPSEWNAWNGYYSNIENLNKLIPAGQSVDITINDAKANGDIIGFRVYAELRWYAG